MRCDYLKATFWGESIFYDGCIQDLFGVRLLQLQEHLGGEWEAEAKGRNGYCHHWVLVRDGETICSGLSEGTGDAAGSHQIEAQGHYAVEVREALNATIGPTGYATARRDTCFDFIDDDAFTMFHQLAAIGRLMCQQEWMGYEQMGKGWLVPGGTMTIYLGSRSSVAYMRIYTRGLKTLAEGGQDDPRRVRVEIEVKPSKKAGKESLSMVDDHALFGCAKWSQEFMRRAGIEGIDRVKVGAIWKPSDQDKAIHHLMTQYGGLLRDLLDKNGPDGLARIITERHEATEEVRRALGRVKDALIEDTTEAW